MRNLVQPLRISICFVDFNFYTYEHAIVYSFKMQMKVQTRMVQLPATAAIEYVAACCRTRTRTRTKTRTKTKTVRGAYARSPQVQCVYEPSRLSVRSIVA